jgi:hypothetical protein
MILTVLSGNGIDPTRRAARQCSLDALTESSAVVLKFNDLLAGYPKKGTMRRAEDAPYRSTTSRRSYLMNCHQTATTGE